MKGTNIVLFYPLFLLERLKKKFILFTTLILINSPINNYLYFRGKFGRVMKCRRIEGGQIFAAKFVTCTRREDR